MMGYLLFLALTVLHAGSMHAEQEECAARVIRLESLNYELEVENKRLGELLRQVQKVSKAAGNTAGESMNVPVPTTAARFVSPRVPVLITEHNASGITANPKNNEDRCSRSPISAFIIQNNCGGSTWTSQLVQSHHCVQHVRQPGDADGSFRGSLASLLKFVEPERPKWPGFSGYTAGAMIFDRSIPELISHFKQQKSRSAHTRVVAILLREPIFEATCVAKKTAMHDLLEKRYGKIGSPKAKKECDSIHHPTHDKCPLSINFTWHQDPAVLLERWREKECGLIIATRLAAQLVDVLRVKLIIVKYADLACSDGDLPNNLRSALGEVLSRRRLEYKASKTSPSNSAHAITNLREVSEYFEKHGHGADARRLLSPSESCAGVTTIRRAVWDVLQSDPDDDVIDENDEELHIPASSKDDSGTMCHSHGTSKSGVL